MSKIIANGVERVTTCNDQVTVVEWMVVRVKTRMANLVLRVPAVVYGKAQAEALRDALLASPKFQETLQRHELTVTLKADYFADHTVVDRCYEACVFATPYKFNWGGFCTNLAIGVTAGLLVGAIAVILKDK